MENKETQTEPAVPRNYFPTYSFSVRLKFCSGCVKFLINDLSMQKVQDGIYSLTYYVCENCKVINNL